jgi:predicted PurR-regulated permease PerM
VTDPNSADAAETEPVPEDVKTELAALRRQVSRLNQQRFLRMHNSMPRLIGVQLVKGLALGFGTVVGATILVSLIALLLSKIDFIPIIGDWAAAIAAQMNAGK